MHMRKTLSEFFAGAYKNNTLSCVLRCIGMAESAPDKTVTLVTGDREYVIRAQGGRLSARQIGHMFQVTLCVYYDVQLIYSQFNHFTATSSRNMAEVRILPQSLLANRCRRLHSWFSVRLCAFNCWRTVSYHTACIRGSCIGCFSISDDAIRHGF